MPAAPATPSAAVVTSTLHGNIMLITIDNPPVNALSVAVRQGLLDAVERADAEPAVAAILLQGAGKNFIGGADIREFGKPPQAPALPDLCNRIEAASKPVIAVIHGAALGGGLEIALSAHYRLACNDAKIGLPEVLLGLLPGAGGTQRTPRLIGAAAALDLMLSGRHVSAAEAHTLGLVDQVHELDEASDASQAGLDYARQLLAQGAAVRRTRDAQALSDVTATQAALGEARQQTQKKARGLFSPLKIIEAVEAAATLPFDQGLQTERNLFLACLESPQRAGLIHAFFADREVLKAPETRNATSRPINSVGVVGGGTMGAGIAVALLDAGLPVTMIERDETALARGRQHIEKVYDGLISKGRLSAAAKATIMARWQSSTDYAALGQVDLVIEAVFEDLSVKQAVFTELDRYCKPGAILATNTSYLDIEAIASSTSRPADVIGLHFFSPANIMKLLEIVVPKRVATEVVAPAFTLAKTLRKVACWRNTARPLISCSKMVPHPMRLIRRCVTSATRWVHSRCLIWPVVTLAGPLANVVRRPVTREHAMSRLPTVSVSKAGSAKRRDAATTATPKARAMDNPTPRYWPSSTASASALASLRATSARTTSSVATSLP